MKRQLTLEEKLNRFEKNQEYQKEYQKKYRKNNRTDILEYQKKYRKANKDPLKENKKEETLRYKKTEYIEPIQSNPKSLNEKYSLPDTLKNSSNIDKMRHFLEWKAKKDQPIVIEKEIPPINEQQNSLINRWINKNKK